MKYERRTYLAMTVDPLHAGTGGYRLGRVDNSIVREPGTNVPKFPGSGIAGPDRAYAAYLYGKPECAGQGQPSLMEPGHCGEDSCPICYTFGFTKPEKSYSGVVSFFDARILLFPVHSVYGPVWVTTKEILGEYDIQVKGPERDDQVNTTMEGMRGRLLNLGWLLFEVGKSDPSVIQTSQHTQSISSFYTHTVTVAEAWRDKIDPDVKKRIVLVTPNIFSQVVNSNLEVRTSVSIDPTTGAARRGALFTFEAIPRATFLAFDVVKNVYRKERFPKKGSASDGTPLNPPWRDPLDVVDAGLRMAELLGLGGMGTRGFGRVKILNMWEVKK